MKHSLWYCGYYRVDNLHANEHVIMYWSIYVIVTFYPLFNFINLKYLHLLSKYS